jgi:hypothetical protein
VADCEGLFFIVGHDDNCGTMINDDLNENPRISRY